MKKCLFFLLCNFTYFISSGQDLSVGNLTDSAKMLYVKILKKNYTLRQAQGSLTASIINNNSLKAVVFFKIEHISSSHSTQLLIIPIDKSNGQLISIRTIKEFNDMVSSNSGVQKYDKALLYLIFSNPLILFELIISKEDTTNLSNRSFLIKHLHITSDIGTVPSKYIYQKKQTRSKAIINYSMRPGFKFNQYVFIFDKKNDIIKIKNRTHRDKYSVYEIGVLKRRYRLFW
ncbi:MAG: hypothetical protein K1X81_14215 [Bacteroidia bacterium]|nr:hypothetical protein [Bacteroidia bacterium]